MFRRVFEHVVRTCIEAGLVGGEGFAVDASLIAADANSQRSIPGVEWKKQIDPAAASRGTPIPIARAMAYQMPAGCILVFQIRHLRKELFAEGRCVRCRSEIEPELHIAVSQNRHEICLIIPIRTLYIPLTPCRHLVEPLERTPRIDFVM